MGLPLPFAILTVWAASLVTAGATQYNVDVGGFSQIVYSPNTLNAQPGDTILFTFRGLNATVTQSAFEKPCTKLPGGFDSGFHPVPSNQTTDFPTFVLTVPDTNPIWIHCEQGRHCQAGMVFAVNPPLVGTQTFQAYQAKALASRGGANGNAAGRLLPWGLIPGWSAWGDTWHNARQSVLSLFLGLGWLGFLMFV